MTTDIGAKAVLLLLAFFVAAVLGEAFTKKLNVIEVPCVKHVQITYIGRDEEGRPSYQYTQVDKCFSGD